jgi:hypothetical protein
MERKRLGAWQDNLYFPQWHLGVITVPKAANTTLKATLVASLDVPDRALIEAKVAGAKDDQRLHDALRKSPFCCAYGRLLEPDVRIILATLRHPVGRLQSFYRDKVVGGGWPPEKKAEVARLWKIDDRLSFDAMVARIAEIPDAESEPHFRSQTALLGADVIDDGRLRLVRTERFETDLDTVAREIGLPLAAGARKNSSAAPPIQISPTARRLIALRYADDFERFYPEADAD